VQEPAKADDAPAAGASQHVRELASKMKASSAAAAGGKAKKGKGVKSAKGAPEDGTSAFLDVDAQAALAAEKQPKKVRRDVSEETGTHAKGSKKAAAEQRIRKGPDGASAGPGKTKKRQSKAE
jgi:hypothetical protein